METTVSLAIETSSRAGGVALGRGQEIIGSIDFPASARHAVQLVPRIDELLTDAGLKPSDVDELYVSSGPGSFTGLRVGFTVARTMGQMLGSLRCVAVPTPLVVANQAMGMPWDRLAVVLDARDSYIHLSTFVRNDGRIVAQGPSQLLDVAEFLAGIDAPVTLSGEGLLYHDCTGAKISIAPPKLYFPTATMLWRVGRQMARDEQYTEYNKLAPTYARPPEVLRLAE